VSAVEWGVLVAGVLLIVAVNVWFLGPRRHGPPVTISREGAVAVANPDDAASAC
jgi:hypothetical protein